MTTKFFETKEQYLAFRQAWAKAAQNKSLTASHMMMYNIIRGRDSEYGFSPFKRHSKIEGMGMINRGSFLAYQWLWYLKQNPYQDYWHERVEEFLKPFDGTLTPEQFYEMDIPKIERIWIVFGSGLRLWKLIRDGYYNPKSCTELTKRFNMEKNA